MAKDPYQRPMSLAESQDLLDGHARHESSMEGWRMVGGIVLFILALIGVGLVTFLSVSSTLVAWIVGVAAIIYALGAIASAGRK